MHIRSSRRLLLVAPALVLVAACGSSTSSAGTQGAASAPTTTGASASSGAAPSGSTCSTKTPPSTDSAIRAAKAGLEKAAAITSSWSGPTDGPKAQKVGGTVVVVPQLSANAGDLGVVNGFKEAARAMGWKVKVIDGGGSTANNLAAFDQALASNPIGIAVSSFDPKSAEPEFAKAKAKGVPVVGNHVGFGPGRQSEAPSLFTNVTSNPAAIARVAVDCAIVASGGKAGVTIAGCGSQVQICTTKEDAMKAEIATCPGCSLLAQHDYPFQDATQREGGIAAADLQKYGAKLTYMLSINDIYWDSAIPALKAAGVGPTGPPLMIAAGDGSPAAFQRIRVSQYQIATVAEPLNEHGWQLADELNRSLANAPASTYVTYPHLTTVENVNSEGGDKNVYDPANGYRDQYKKIWGVG